MTVEVVSVWALGQKVGIDCERLHAWKAGPQLIVGIGNGLAPKLVSLRVIESEMGVIKIVSFGHGFGRSTTNNSH